MLSSVLALVALLPAFVLAQSPVYGQCGGQGWTRMSGNFNSGCDNLRFRLNLRFQQPLLLAVPAWNGRRWRWRNDYCDQHENYDDCRDYDHGLYNNCLGSIRQFNSCCWQPVYRPQPIQIYLTPFYAAEVAAAAANITDATTQAKALSVAKIPTFTWFDTIAKVPDLGTYLADASAQGKASGTPMIVQIIVYDLPDRDCAAAASNGEFSIADNGQANYFNYIDELVAQIKQFPDVRVVAIIEPDSLANLVTNLSVQKCANAQTTYLACVTYAIQQLNKLGNVYSYLDAGHAGWLGWPANLTPAAQLFASLFKNAGSPNMVRGLATNVANYNALAAASPDPITQGNANYDEIHYINALAPVLSSSGFPAHFIVDQGRSGVQNIRQQWGDWCNVKGAGFGTRPTSNTGYSTVDAIVWAKPGGECDGTSNTSAARYDYHCGLSDADQPAPEAGTWFQEYFTTLVTKANPPL
ncbi:cellobiohydrolase II [Mycena belliarum]|uniref:Glucanase n=1 Tax=Mycena belliarum TaxID=1033014 RepID=A0AAD6U5L4_9AGAR|nr:cellobiohydrolase II [Mycena belliae]